MKTQIRVTEGYHPCPNASPTQRTVKSFGYLEDQTDQEAFWKEVNACNDNLKHKRDPHIEISLSEMMYSGKTRLHWITGGYRKRLEQTFSLQMLYFQALQRVFVIYRIPFTLL